MANQIDAIFSALADPTRRAVIAQLAAGARPVGALAAPHDMALPSFLRHIEVPEAAGLVATRKQGRQRMVALRPRSLDPIADWLDGQRRLRDGRLARLEAVARRLELENQPDAGAGRVSTTDCAAEQTQRTTDRRRHGPVRLQPRDRPGARKGHRRQPRQCLALPHRARAHGAIVLSEAVAGA